ncbi:MAG: YHS domain-containing (seleno)protein [Paracoccaceae bacterium]
MTTRRQVLKYTLAVPMLGATMRPAFAAPEFYDKDGMAATGFDVVAYFTEDQAVDGSDDFSLQWKGAMWRFSSAENLAAFEADPWAFAPQYGGYCAFAMAKGAIWKSVPKAYSIYEGQLYLNQSMPVRALWRRDIPGNIADANGFWPAILQQS